MERFLSSKSIEDQITVMVSFSAEFWDLFVLTATFSSDHPDAYSEWRERWNLVWRDAEISMGDAENLNGGTLDLG